MTKVCPACGAQYIASVNQCSDCLVELVPEESVEGEGYVPTPTSGIPGDLAFAEADEGDDDGDGDGLVEEIAYQLDSWQAGSVASLAAMLDGTLIPHVWDDTRLVVPADHEEAVDRLVQQVELTEQPTLDPDAEQIEYELEGWSDEKRGILDEHLFAREIRHGWDEAGQLIVEAHDELTTEAIIDTVDESFDDAGQSLSQVDPETDADAVTDAVTPVLNADGEELTPQDVMSNLFDAADRLMHRPKESSAARELAAATTEAESLPLPYGFTDVLWDDLVSRSRGLRDLVEAAEIDERAVNLAATELRERLRDLV